MPGAGRSDSPVLRWVGAVVAVVAIAGAAVGDWRFDGLVDGQFPFAIAVAAVTLAVGASLYARYG